MTTIKNITKYTGVGLMLLPFTAALLYFLIIELGQSSGLVIAFLLLPATIAFLIGFVLFLIFEKAIKRKIVITSLAIASLILILPSAWLIQDIKQAIFLDKNKEVLENVAINVLDEKMSIEEANEMLDKLEIHIRIMDCESIQDRQVLFTISKFIDNCYGLAYCQNCEQEKFNCCGQLTSWDYLEKNWFKWTTT